MALPEIEGVDKAEGVCGMVCDGEFKRDEFAKLLDCPEFVVEAEGLDARQNITGRYFWGAALSALRAQSLNPLLACGVAPFVNALYAGMDAFRYFCWPRAG